MNPMASRAAAARSSAARTHAIHGVVFGMWPAAVLTVFPFPVDS
jgi:hypothetical protein